MDKKKTKIDKIFRAKYSDGEIRVIPASHRTVANAVARNNADGRKYKLDEVCPSNNYNLQKFKLIN